MTAATAVSSERSQPIRLVIRSALLLLSLWLAWQIVLNVVREDLARNPVANTASWIPKPPAFRLRIAESEIRQAGEETDWETVESIAKQALGASPLEHRALVLLALAAETRGDDDERITTLMRLAGQRSLYDWQAHLWLFYCELQARNFARAMHHADVVLRSRHRGELLEPLVQLLSHPEGAEALITMLHRKPRWRASFLSTYSRQAADPSDPSPLYAALFAGPNPPSNSELRSHLDRLISSGRFEQAFLIWRRSLPSSQKHDMRYLYNGHFEHEVTQLPFDWIISQVRGAEINFVEAPSGSGRAMRIDFARGRIDFRHVSKLLMLPPGTYRLAGQAEARQFGNQRGLHWQVTCAIGDRDVLAVTSRLAGNAPRHSFSETFTVPMSGCRAQWLRLELAARVALEREVSGGTVWYDSLEVQRLQGLPAS